MSSTHARSEVANAPDWLTARRIAHRGLHDLAAGVPENTRAAAEAAIAAGCAIECDVQLSRDGEAMVFHDFGLQRLCGREGAVAASSADELGAMEVGSTRETIPTLAAFLDLIAGRVPLVVEIKSRFDGDERLARRTAEVLGGREAPIAVKSFDPQMVALMRRIAPGTPRGIVAQSRYEGGDWDQIGAADREAMAQLLHWEDTRPDFLSWRHSDLPTAAAHLPRMLARIPVMTWTVRSQAAANVVRPHVDQIVFEGFRPL